MAVNLRAPSRTYPQELLPLLAKSEHASVVFASSGVGRESRERWGAYSGLYKIAIEAVSQLFAKENVHPNIRYNCINQGCIKLARPCAPKPIQMKIQKLYLHPDAIMPAYLYLMGDNSCT